MPGLTRQQLLGRQAVPNDNPHVEIDPLAGQKPRFSADHHAPISSVRVHVQRHFGNEGVLPIEDDASKYDEVAIQAEREAKQAQLAELQTKVQQRARKTAAVLKQQQLAVAAQQEQAVRLRAQRAQQYNQQVSQRNLKGIRRTVTAEASLSSPGSGDVHEPARDQGYHISPTSNQASAGMHQCQGSVAWEQNGGHGDAELWPLQAGTLQQHHLHKEETDLGEEPSAACWAHRQQHNCRRSVDRASWKDADTSSESSDEGPSTHSRPGAADTSVLLLPPAGSQQDFSLTAGSPCTLQPAQMSITPNPRAVASAAEKHASPMGQASGPPVAHQELVQTLRLPLQPLDGDAARACMLRHAVGSSGLPASLLSPGSGLQGKFRVSDGAQDAYSRRLTPPVDCDTPSQPAVAGCSCCPRESEKETAAQGSCPGCEDGIQGTESPQVVRIFSKPAPSDSSRSVSTSQHPPRKGAIRRRAPPGTICLDDPLSLIRARQQAAQMQVTLPSLCSCPSGCSMFDPLYTNKCTRNCPLFNRPDLHESLLNQMLHTHNVLSSH